MPVTKANLNAGHLWTTVIPQKIPGMLRPLYRISNGDIDGDKSAMLTENERPLGPGGACMRTSVKWDKADIAAGLALLFFCLYIGKLAFTELWLIGKGLPAELWRYAKKHHPALQEKQN
jgi:hypothetical protein